MRTAVPARWARGTVASLVALALGYLLHRSGGFPLLFTATTAVALASAWAGARGDGRATVAGEAAGQWIALFPLSAGLWWMGAPPALFPWPGWVGAFLMYRLFQLWRLGRLAHGGGAGAVLGDIAAGLAAAAVVAAAAAVAHGALM